MLILTDATSSALEKGTELAIAREREGSRVQHFQSHQMVKELYNWRNVAQRTQIVYDNIIKNNSKNLTVTEKVLR